MPAGTRAKAHYNMQSKNLLKTAIIIFVISSGSAIAEISTSDPFAFSNFSPLIKIHGLPSPRSANIMTKGGLRGTIQASLSNNFSESLGEQQSILLDGETLNTELSIDYGLGNKAELTLVVPYSKHIGGNLDGFIENWHSFFDLPDGGRRHSPKNRLLYQVKNDGRESFALGPNSTGAFGDISIIFSKNLSDRKNQLWKVSAGVKLPSGKFSDLSGSEFTSFFSMAHYSNLSILRFPKWHFNQTLGVLKNNADNLFETKVKSLVYFGSSQVGRKVRERLDLKFQLDYHTSFYSSDLKQLGKASAQLVLGGTIKVSESFALDLSITEDIAANTAPDVTFSLGLRRTF